MCCQLYWNWIRSGPDPLWIAAAIFGWRSLALTNSMVTLAPVFFMKSSSICFLKNGSASGMKLCHCRTDRLTPFKLGRAAGLAAGAAPAAGEGAGEAAGEAPAAGLAAGAGAAGLGASVGLAGAVAPPQAVNSITPAPLAATRKKLRRAIPRPGMLTARDLLKLFTVLPLLSPVSGSAVQYRLWCHLA